MCLSNDEVAAESGRRAVAIGTTIHDIRRKLCNRQVPASRVERLRQELARLHATDATVYALAEALTAEGVTPEGLAVLLLGLRRMLNVRHNGEITTALSHRLPDRSDLLRRVAIAIEDHAARQFFSSRR